MKKRQMQGIFGSLLLLLFIFYQRIKIKTKEALKYKDDLKRMKKLYAVLNRWLVLEICNKNIGEILEKKGYRTAAVYGMGELGQRLTEKLETGSKMEVLYGMDRNAQIISALVPVYRLEEALKFGEPDVVILTAYSRDDSLMNRLQAGFSCPIIRIEELLNEAE